MDDGEFEKVWAVLQTLQAIAPGQKLAVASTGDLSIEDVYTARNLFRRLRRDGYQATLHVLHEVAVKVTDVLLYFRSTRIADRAEAWADRVMNASRSVQCLATTYEAEGHADAKIALQRVARVLGDAAIRFRELADEPPRKSSSLKSSGFLSTLLMVNTNDELS